MAPVKKHLLVGICFVLALDICAQHHSLDLTGGDKASLVGEGWISTNRYERDFAISPDGKEIFYTLQMPQNSFQTILYTRKNAAGKWSDPVVASFAGHYSDLEPAFSNDGLQLFFVSNRPLTGTEKKDFDIWVVNKTGSGWGEAKNLGAPVNSPVNEFYPSVAASGNIYFTAEYPNASGKEDIFMCRWNGSSFGNPEKLDSAINSLAYEFNAYVSPNEQYIIFSSFGRKDEKGGGDLYLSKKDQHGNWQPAQNIQLLNSVKLDYCPFLSPDKKTLYFTSEQHAMQKTYEKKPVSYAELVDVSNSALNGSGNIYKINFEVVLRSLTGFQHE